MISRLATALMMFWIGFIGVSQANARIESQLGLGLSIATGETRTSTDHPMNEDDGAEIGASLLTPISRQIDFGIGASALLWGNRGVDDLRIRVYCLDAEVRLRIGRQRFVPFVAIGPSLGQIRTSVENVPTTSGGQLDAHRSIAWTPGLKASVGMSFPISMKVGLLAGLVYRHLFTQGSDSTIEWDYDVPDLDETVHEDFNHDTSWFTSRVAISISL